jgi:hypothetical protein
MAISFKVNGGPVTVDAPLSAGPVLAVKGQFRPRCRWVYDGGMAPAVFNLS